jgi:hydrogenase maturation protease
MAGREPKPLVCRLASLGDTMACTQQATDFARAAGFDERGAWEIGIAASELATNITRHGGGGTLTLRVVTEPDAGVELLAEDDGPGIADVDSALLDDFSEGQVLSHNVPPTLREGLGSGLGAVHRLTDAMSIESRPGEGTTVRALKRLPSRRPSSVAAPVVGVPVKPVLILGLGNAILCDDGVGIKAIRFLAETGPHPGIDLKEAEVAGFALLDLLEGYDRAVVIDAVRVRDAEPGDIVVFSSESLEPSLHLVAGHQIDLPSALEMGRQLDRPVPHTVHIVGVQVLDDRTFDEHCTPAVEAAVPSAARIALRIAAAGR